MIIIIGCSYISFEFSLDWLHSRTSPLDAILKLSSTEETKKQNKNEM